jgi:hypothetical protein
VVEVVVELTVLCVWDEVLSAMNKTMAVAVMTEANS